MLCSEAEEPFAAPVAQAYDAFVEAFDTGDEYETVDGMRESLAKSYDPVRNGNIVLVLNKYDIFTEKDRGTSHGSPWDYDRHIPLIMYGKGVRKGVEIDDDAVQQDIVPTLAYRIGTDAPVTAEGRVLHEAFETRDGERPKVAVMMVLDQVAFRYLDEYKWALRNVRKIAQDGVSYTNMRVPHLPTITTVGHSALGTGAYPATTGIVGHNIYDPDLDAMVYAMEGGSPQYLEAETLADVYDRSVGNRARIVSVGGADRTAIGMAGHGTMSAGGDSDDVFWFDPDTGRFESNDAFYSMPDYLLGMDIMDYSTPTFKGHTVDDPEVAMASPALPMMMGDALVKVLDNEDLGSSDVTDLMFANFKSPDYVGHAYGQGPELFLTLLAVDRSIGRVKEKLDELYGDDYMLVITADHGAAPNPERTGGRRVHPDQFVERINSEFNGAVRFNEPAGGIMNLYVDEDALALQGKTLEDVKDTLESYDEVFHAFTEDEIQS